MVSPLFYLNFKKYRYLLIYQLDALVFRDELLEWCSKEIDYIGFYEKPILKFNLKLHDPISEYLNSLTKIGYIFDEMREPKVNKELEKLKCQHKAMGLQIEKLEKQKSEIKKSF